MMYRAVMVTLSTLACAALNDGADRRSLLRSESADRRKVLILSQNLQQHLSGERVRVCIEFDGFSLLTHLTLIKIEMKIK